MSPSDWVTLFGIAAGLVTTLVGYRKRATILALLTALRKKQK